VTGSILFLLSPLLLVWGRFQLVVLVCLRVAIITRNLGCGIWVFAAFWGTLFQLAVSPFNCIERLMEDRGEKVERMLSAEASHDQTVEDRADKTKEEDIIAGLTKKYPCWTPKAPVEGQRRLKSRRLSVSLGEEQPSPSTKANTVRGVNQNKNSSSTTM
jgi:hypothetical protein